MKLAVRRRAVAVVAVAMLAAVAGCGIQEQTQRWYPTGNGVNADAGPVGLRNILVVSDGEGQATLIGAFANSGREDDALLEVSIGEVTVEPVDGSLDLPADGYAIISPETNRVDFDDVELMPGRTAPVEFRFANAPRTTVDALVFPDDGEYASALSDELTPTEAPTSQETPGPGNPTTQETPGGTANPTTQQTPGPGNPTTPQPPRR